MKNKWQIWWKQTRPHTLTASFVPVFIGSVLAYGEGSLDYTLLAFMLIASVLIQIATNNFNEYYDFKRGLDTEDSVGIGGAIVRDGIKPGRVLTLALTLYFIAMLLGLYIIIKTSWWIAVIGAISMAFGYLYSGGPYPIAYTPFGEFFSGLFMGIGIVAISFYIHTGFVTQEIFFIALPIAVLIGGILMSNNIRDLDGDKERGRKTLAILLGREKAIKFLAGMFIFSYLWCVYLIFIDYLPLWSLLVVLSVPSAYGAITKFQGKKLPIEMMPAMKLTGKTNTLYGLFYGLGILLGIL
ncbi:MAG: 1,4-dihydroxy-2-naphthoate polyprenyltransferase [Clostridia bacterium]|jgi:1,4-dihydroxy-2-naphthoate octaprenyltransferase|nr:1,4-dihydroxy-2-naphthoate polyprenyltransferase [Clostridia bacterium]